jgi:glycosyltransferase involved in cell wall biosynthesis
MRIAFLGYPMPTADGTAPRLRILVVAPVTPFRGGIAQFSTMLVNALRAEHDVTCWAIDPLYPSALFPGNSRPATGSTLWCRIEARIHGWNPIAWATAWRTVRHHAFDIVIWQWWTPYWVPFLLMLVAQANMRGIATIALNHQLVEPDAPQWQELIARMMLTLADAVVHFGNSTPMHRTHRFLPLPLHGALLQRQQTSVNIRHVLAIPDDAFVVLCFGFVRPYKGIDIVLSAMQRTSPQIHLLLAGEWWHNDPVLRAQCRERTIAARIHVVDHYIPDEDVAAYFAAADVVALPYRSGSVSGVATLAASAGIPLLVSDVGALAGLATVRQVVAPNTPDAWAAALQQAYVQGTPPVTPIPDNSSWQALVQSIVELTASVAGGPK